MNDKTIYDYLVLLGRFQPFHDGHLKVVRLALEQCNNLIIGIGSVNRSRSDENPWTYDERIGMILGALHPLEKEKISFVPVNDFPYNDTAWTVHVNQLIKGEIDYREGGRGREVSVGLIGFKKDQSSRYLDYFPNWDFVDVGEQHGIFSATHIRDQYFDRKIVISEFVPDNVKAFLKGWTITPEYKWVLNEFEYLREYPKLWGPGPFITVDAVVEQMGYVLLVTRRDAPFKGKLAIPGGFIHNDEWIAKARIRELKEETRLADAQGEMPPAKLQSFLVKEKHYDDPKRSRRGRVITFAGLYRLPPAKELYKVIGSDDAEKAEWYNFADLDPTMFMEDHYFIIEDMLGITAGV